MSLITEELEPLPVLEIAAIQSPRSIHAKRKFAVVFGPICAESRIHLAIEAAKRADASLLLAGDVLEQSPHGQYWRHTVLPRLDRRRRWIGAASTRRIHSLVSAARCVLIPGPLSGASSQLAWEALEQGTPVVAFESSGLSTIIEHGRTGFLVQDETEMADAIHAVAFIDSEACRHFVRKRFAAEVTPEWNSRRIRNGGFLIDGAEHIAVV